MPKLILPNRKQEAKLAINIYDIDSLDSSIRQGLLGGRVDLSQYIDVIEGREKTHGLSPSDIGLAFNCPLIEAATVCDWIRSNDRLLSQRVTRCYIQRKDAWTRISDNISLTEIADGNIVLSDFLGNPSPILIAPSRNESGILILRPKPKQ